MFKAVFSSSVIVSFLLAKSEKVRNCERHRVTTDNKMGTGQFIARLLILRQVTATVRLGSGSGLLFGVRVRVTVWVRGQDEVK